MEPEKKPNGALVGTIVIVIILILGGIYVWQSKIKNMENQRIEQEQRDNANSGTSTQTESELNALDQDLNSTDIELGVDVNTIE